MKFISLFKRVTHGTRIYDKNGFGFIISYSPELVETEFTRTQTILTVFGIEFIINTKTVNDETTQTL